MVLLFFFSEAKKIFLPVKLLITISIANMCYCFFSMSMLPLTHTGGVYTMMLLMNTVTLVFVFTEETMLQYLTVAA